MAGAKNAIDRMTALEWRAVSSLASIYALRMMGLFMILPVFALYAQGLDHVTPTLVGMAIGAYGLTQAVLSIPYGMLSDRFGRKRIISIGLVIFAVGSVVAALSDSIYGVIFGRAVQGAGAIAAVVMALTSDLTREEHRLRAMAVIGMSIGVSFALSMVLGPVLNHWIGVRGIFWLTAVLAILGIIVMYTWVPEVVDSRFHRDTQAMPALFKTVLQDGQLLRLDAGIMFLHIILTATFVVIPLALRDHGGLPAAHHWYVYLPVMLAGFVLMAPFIILAEGKRRMKQVFVGAIIILALSELALALSYRHLMGAAIFLSTMFAAFNLLEACLPSLVAKTVSADRKGTAMGVYSSAQFLGAFIGGVAGGWLHGKYGIGGVFSFCAGVGLLWFLIAYTMRSPRYLSSYLVKVGPVDEQQAQALVVQLTGVRGVAEALVIPEDGIAYLKVDLHALDKEALLRFSVEHE